MKSTLRYLAATAGLGALLACAPSTPDNCAGLPGGGRYCLQPSGAAAPFDALQSVTIEAGGRRHTLIASIESDASGIRVAALTPFGQKLFALAYDNTGVRLEAAPPADLRLDPTLLLALLQLAQWPGRATAAGLAPPLRLESEGGRRRVVDGDRVLLLIERDGQAPPYRRLRIAAPAFGYAVEVETLPADISTGTTP